MPNLPLAGGRLCLAAAALLLASSACVPASPEDAKPVSRAIAPKSASSKAPSKAASTDSSAANQPPSEAPNKPTQELPGPPGLFIPVQGVAASQLRDSFTEARGQLRSHEALDIMAPRGTPVLAADDGPVVKLFLSKAGGVTLYQFDSSQHFAYYYAHLDRYADGIAEGQVVRRGVVIGYVGSTGNADAAAPHLHFAIFRLGPEKQWWKGQAINPFAYLGGRKP